MQHPSDSSTSFRSVDAFGKQLDTVLRQDQASPSRVSMKLIAGVAGVAAMVAGGGLATAELLGSDSPQPLVSEGSLTGELVLTTSKYGGDCEDGQLVVDLVENHVATRCNDGSSPNLTQDEQTSVEAMMRKWLASAG